MKMLNMEEKGFMCVQQRWRNWQHKDGPGLKAHTGTSRRCSWVGHGSWEDIQEVLMRRAWVLGELGSHLASQSHDPHEQETLKRNTIMKGTLCRLRRTMWLGPPQHHIASDSINVHNAEVFKGTYFRVLWVAWFFVTGLMSNGRALFMGRRNISRNTVCWHQREAGNQGRSNPAQQKTCLLLRKLMGC